MRELRILLAAGCAALMLAGPARAADSDLEQARQHAAKAKVHYDLGEYEKAADEYIIVYRIRPLPALLFNIGQAYRQAGQYDKSKQFYQAYLRESPDAENSAAVKKALKEIDELQAKEKLAKAAPPTGVKQPPDTSLPIKAGAAGGAAVAGAATAGAAGAAPASTAAKPGETAKVAVATQPPPRAAVPGAAVAPATTTSTTAPTASSGSGTRTAAWIAGGTAVALLGGGLLFTAKASSTDSTLNGGGHTRAEADDLMSQSNSQHKMGGVLLGLGLAAAGTCAVLFFLP